MKRRLWRVLAAGVCVGVAVVVTGATSAQAQAFYPTKYLIYSRSAQKCVDVVDGNFANGAEIQIWDCNDQTWQQLWGFDRTGSYGADPIFHIAAKHTYYGKCIEVVGIVQQGRLVQQQDCGSSGRATQGWIQEYMTTDQWETRWYRYHLEANPGLCLDISGNGTYNGARLQVWGCHNGYNQQFANIPMGSFP